MTMKNHLDSQSVDVLDVFSQKRERTISPGYKTVVLTILLVVSFANKDNKGLVASSSPLPDNFTSTTERITLIRDCNKRNRHYYFGSSIASLGQKYYSPNATISTTPTRITFSFAAEISNATNTTNSMNTSTDSTSLIRFLNQMILETAAEAILSCKTTGLLTSEAPTSVVAISLETSAVSELSSQCSTYISSPVTLNACYVINDTLSVSFSDKAVEDWVIYDALMGIKLSMVDDLYLSSTSSNARDVFQNIQYLQPDPSILRSSYANSISKSVHIVLFITLMLSLSVLLFIMHALYKRREQIFRWKGGARPFVIIPKYKLSTIQDSHLANGVML
jgi:hypothetical protein